MTLLQHWASLFYTYSGMVIYEVHKEYLNHIKDKPEELIRYQQQIKDIMSRINDDINP